MAQSKAVSKKQNNEVTLSNGFFENDFTGWESATDNMFAVPFLKIAQKTTPQANKKKPAYIEGLEPGHFFNTASLRDYGDSIRVVVFAPSETYVQWGADMGDFNGQHSPEEFKQIERERTLTREGALLVDPEDGSRYQQTITLFCMLPDYIEEGVVVFPLASTGLTPARKLLSKMRATMYNGKRPPLYASIWNLWTEYFENEKGDWYQIGNKQTLCASFDTWVPPELQEPVLETAEIAREYVQNRDKIDFSNAAGEDHTTDSEAEAF